MRTRIVLLPRVPLETGEARRLSPHAKCLSHRRTAHRTLPESRRRRRENALSCGDFRTCGGTGSDQCLDFPVRVRLAIGHAGTANAPAGNMTLTTCIATRVEKRRPLPGDTIVPQPVFSVTHAITIDAPIERVWPWLAQMGSDRAG